MDEGSPIPQGTAASAKGEEEQAPSEEPVPTAEAGPANSGEGGGKG